MITWCIRGGAVAALTALAGCVLGPDFVPPDPQLPVTSFTGDRRTAEAPPDPSWWAVFRDPILTGLERRISADNLDVQTATIRLAESRFQRGVAAAAQFPTLNGDAKYQRELFSVKSLPIPTPFRVQ
jgi:outer membrane protein TolC